MERAQASPGLERSAAGAELFRRMITRRLGLLRPAAAGAYLASLAPFAAELPRGPLRTLDEFYLVNRAGRWSAAARQAYLIRSPLADRHGAWALATLAALLSGDSAERREPAR